MKNAAAMFDAPLTSAEHSSLRETAWMGGALVEGRYLLGRLQGENLFVLSNADFSRTLERHFSEQFAGHVATVLAGTGIDLGVCALRWECRHMADIALRNPREAQAIFLLARHRSLTDAQLADTLGTTPKQIKRASSVGYFRRLLGNDEK